MKRLILIVSVFFSIQLFAQNINPGADEIYREDEVAKIYLTMTSEDSTALLDDVDIWSDEYLPTGFRFMNSLMDTTLEFEVGIRLRGNTSREKPKKSLKIKFKEFDGSKYYGYKKFNLKAEVNDPSMVREMLSLQTFRNANVAAARSHHAEVYMNGGYLGLYLNVEQLDDEFVDSRF
ncbi:MAG: CotH kinase family protein, partial [Bacteroidetes bacterium]|nr:CotH kinase family protein [Bacteroidota bacterium]